LDDRAVCRRSIDSRVAAPNGNPAVEITCVSSLRQMWNNKRDQREDQRSKILFHDTAY
jgi:hypothetical protein